ncbi:hypothetical protein [Streptomyces sp. Tue6028]|uniref:hypothetical protein n=1 Tax=Streptomyces sp. Tue6028 TaxID=2036037 RepID=UPI003D719080
MRTPFAQEAVLVMAADGDVRAPGAAVTVALCGDWEHEPPCPLAPHHTSAERCGDEVRLRVLFAADPADEAEARTRIESALSQSTFRGPDGVTTRWRLRGTRPSPVRPDETEHAERLASPQ